MLIDVILLITSIIIYASFGITNLIFILFSTITSYIAARSFKYKYKKTILISTILINAIILLFIKLILFNENIFNQFTSLNFIILLGISYYTLQVISYLIDVYKGKYDAEKNIFKYVLYIMYIPHLFIGPISKYDEVKEILFKKRKITWDNLYFGSLRILWGLFKKLVIAGRIAIVTSTIASNAEVYSGWYVIIAVFMYSIQLYSDFSGGIDIVLGISKIIGIDLQENFDSPFYSESIKEFWRRWHISLGSWLREYIYIPLGGNKKGTLRKNINLLITFIVSGIWHGINYILWGILHGIFVMSGNNCKTRYKWLNRVITFIIVSFLWTFFMWSDTLTAVKMIASIFTNFNIVDIIQNISNLGLTLNNWIVLSIFILILFIYDGNKTKIDLFIKRISPEIKTGILCILILTILVFGIYGFGFNVNEFIYSNF